jgi:hypothetical protein
VSFLEGISDVGSLTRSDLASLVNEGIRNGLSGNAMQAMASEAGVGIRRSDFQQLVTEVRSSIANESAIQALGANEIADESLVTQWTGGATDTYLHRVTLYVREGPPGNKEIMLHNFDILNDHIMSGAEAVASAQELFVNGQADDNYADQELLGADMRNIYHQQGGG